MLTELNSQRTLVPKMAKREAWHVSHDVVRHVVEYPNAKYPQRERSIAQPQSCARRLRLSNHKLLLRHSRLVHDRSYDGVLSHPFSLNERAAAACTSANLDLACGMP
jgi:hypothetical protein